MSSMKLNKAAIVFTFVFFCVFSQLAYWIPTWFVVLENSMSYSFTRGLFLFGFLGYFLANRFIPNKYFNPINRVLNFIVPGLLSLYAIVAFILFLKVPKEPEELQPDKILLTVIKSEKPISISRLYSEYYISVIAKNNFAIHVVDSKISGRQKYAYRYSLNWYKDCDLQKPAFKDIQEFTTKIMPGKNVNQYVPVSYRDLPNGKYCIYFGITPYQNEPELELPTQILKDSKVDVDINL